MSVREKLFCGTCCVNQGYRHCAQRHFKGVRRLSSVGGGGSTPLGLLGSLAAKVLDLVF